jgi:hypothetical protein
MKKIAILCLLAAPACTRVDYLDYRGVQEWPVGSAFVQCVDGMDVYEGLPNRAYEVIGMIDVYDDKPFFLSDDTKKKVLDLAKEHSAQALVWLSDRTITSGYLKMGTAGKNSASIDTGRSSQPEMMVTQVSQYVATSYKKSLRSSLLIVRWK